LILAFLARAPLYLSVFPPFEGWDEYQHVAYIAHLDEAGTVPVFDQSWVPTALRPLMISVPHSQWGGDQVRQWGARSYPEYWNSATSTYYYNNTVIGTSEDRISWKNRNYLLAVATVTAATFMERLNGNFFIGGTSGGVIRQV